VLLDTAGIDVSTDPRGQDSPSCASDGADFLVSFNTYRCDSAYSDIYVSRVRADGAVLDTDGFVVCNAQNQQERSKVTAVNGNYFVIWEDERNFDSTGYDIYGTRVTPTGVVVDSGGRRITNFKNSEIAPAMATDGNDFLAVWQSGDYGQVWDVAGMRLDDLGQVIDTGSTLISRSCDVQLTGASAWNGSSFLAVWEEDHDIYGARFDRFGNLLDSGSLKISTADGEQDAPDVTSGGYNFMAVWEDSRNGNFDIYASRIDSGGTVLDSSGIPILVDPSFGQRNPKIAFDGTNYLVVWHQVLDSLGTLFQIEGKRIDRDGVSIDPQPIVITAGDKQRYADVAFGGGKYLVVWSDENYWDIYGAFVDTNGTVFPSFVIRSANGLQQNPVVASDGENFLVVWEDFGTHWPDANIFGTRVSSAGQVLDPGAIEIAYSYDTEEHPSVTFDGRNYLVSWNKIVWETGYLYTSRITPSGVLLDEEGILITEVSPYSKTFISTGPPSLGMLSSARQSLLLYSRYQGDSYNSLRLTGAFFWGEAEPNLPPASFSLLLPANQDTVLRNPVSFDWEDAPDPNTSDRVTYTLYVSPSPQFEPESTIIIDSLTTSQYNMLLADSLAYWWKVKAYDKWGEVRWSNEVFSFDLENYGDVNSDGNVDVGDVILLVNYLFRSGPAPSPLARGDVNGDCLVDVGDVVYLINYLFKGGPQPVRGCA
jgi:hypothetical protein